MQFLIIILFLIFAPAVFASDPPILTNPSDGSTVASSALNWQAPSYPLYSSNPYRVQVDDDSSFASINKDYYTNNTHYTPVLNYGTWYWRVKAKDSANLWSDWSNIWSFNLVASVSTPTPTASSTPAPTPSPSPTSTPSPTPIPSTSSSTSKIKTSTTVSKTPSPTPQPTILLLPSSKNEMIPSPSKSQPKIVYHIASVAAISASASPSATVEIKGTKFPNLLPWIGIILVICGIGSLIYIYLRQGKIHEILYNLFRK